MTPRHAGSERFYRRLLRAYPAEFRARFTDDMVQLFGDQLRGARDGGSAGASGRVWLRSLGDLAVSSAAERIRRDRNVAHTLAAAPSSFNRVLGLAGIVGGAILLAAFVVEISPELNVLRLVLFNLGAMAIVVAVHRRQAPAAPTLALVAAIPALLANAWYLAMTVLAIGNPQPFGGDFGLVWFYAAVAMWLTDALFGVVTLRIGVVARWGALALAIGSPLAFAGIDRLGLVSPANPTIWGPLALTGAALNGMGWILLGLDVATSGRGAEDGQPRARLRE